MAYTVEVTRSYRASARELFRAWVDPALIETWWGPEGFKTVVTELDAREGGAFRFEMTAPTGSLGATAGIYHEIVPGERLVFEITEHCNCDLPSEAEPQLGPGEVTVEFQEVSGVTVVRVVHRGLASDAVGGRFRGGWASGLECLARTLAQLTPTERSDLGPNL